MGKINKIDKILGVNRGNSVVSKYRNERFQRGLSIGGALMDFTFASQHALEHEAGWTAVFGGFTCLMMKLAKDSHLKLKELRPQYKEIVARAKEIYKK